MLVPIQTHKERIRVDMRKSYRVKLRNGPTEAGSDPCLDFLFFVHSVTHICTDGWSTISRRFSIIVSKIIIHIYTVDMHNNCKPFVNNQQLSRLNLLFFCDDWMNGNEDSRTFSTASSCLLSKGLITGDSGRPGATTARWPAGTILLIAWWKSEAAMSILVTSSCSLSLEVYICGYLLRRACRAASVHKAFISAPQ